MGTQSSILPTRTAGLAESKQANPLIGAVVRKLR